MTLNVIEKAPSTAALPEDTEDVALLRTNEYTYLPK